ncbi:sigma-70 family RNA polymerase sigma factor [Lysobacter sp. ISL-42]|nr:sigma-70 family RNA polymerase sigma factor [Lysobacter sp. ISL-42]MBT2751419.1 sigma-70 family RNA polymerase sigma factor [Lysobacter sp. ISL-50]MBT2777361.1 sigma-70 family RNA polymerase sigma factor [Lysobacter sp. ISL-54]MBT2781563.1 sigma-70 family RNA polymerase sigma factor [Lysobacter sp. ISL-52]
MGAQRPGRRRQRSGAGAAAFRGAAAAHHGLVYKIANSHCRGDEDRADLAQEIAVQLWRAFPDFRRDQAVRTRVSCAGEDAFRIMQLACANSPMRIRDHGSRPLGCVAHAHARSRCGRKRSARTPTNSRRQKAPISGGFRDIRGSGRTTTN